MPLKSIKDKIKNKKHSIKFGTITKISSTVIIAEGLDVSIGDIVKIVSNHSELTSRGMVTELDGAHIFITPFSFVEGLEMAILYIIMQVG